MATRLYGIRGATGAENTRESIQQNVAELCRRLFVDNGIESANLVSIQFTMTADLDALNPCYALRHGDVGVDVARCALFAAQEPLICGAPERMVRVLITVYMEEDASPRHCYINGAEVLRPDLAAEHERKKTRNCVHHSATHIDTNAPIA